MLHAKKTHYTHLQCTAYTMSSTLTVQSTVIALCLIYVNLSMVTGCNLSDEYECSNLNCVPLDLVNNTVNDCEDNSDEVRNPCRTPMFSCHNDRCILMEWVRDGNNDCVDGSDEAKLIGTACTPPGGLNSDGDAPACCPCSESIAHSECLLGTCQCVPGYYTNQFNTTCTLRMIGDPCSDVVTCSDGVPHSSCVSEQCQCDIGYQPSQDNSTCAERRVDDSCEGDIDCNTTLAHSECSLSGRCTCTQPYYARNIHACRLKSVGDPCLLDMDCIAAPHSLCINELCECTSGYKSTIVQPIQDLAPPPPRTDPHPATVTQQTVNNYIPRLNDGSSKSFVEFECTPKTVRDPCTSQLDCWAVSDSWCSTAAGVCQCMVGYVSSTSGRACRRQRVGDICIDSVDCTRGGVDQDLVCGSSGRCGCAYGYRPASHTGGCETDPTFRDSAVTAVIVAVIVILIVVVVVMLTYMICRFVCKCPSPTQRVRTSLDGKQQT